MFDPRLQAVILAVVDVSYGEGGRVREGVGWWWGLCLQAVILAAVGVSCGEGEGSSVGCARVGRWGGGCWLCSVHAARVCASASRRAPLPSSPLRLPTGGCPALPSSPSPPSCVVPGCLTNSAARRPPPSQMGGGCHPRGSRSNGGHPTPTCPRGGVAPPAGRPFENRRLPLTGPPPQSKAGTPPPSPPPSSLTRLCPRARPRPHPAPRSPRRHLSLTHLPPTRTPTHTAHPPTRPPARPPA